MKKFIKAIQVIKHPATFKKLGSLMCCFLICIFYRPSHLFSQVTQTVGLECGIILIPGISSSGTKDSNYSIGINSIFDLNSKWSIGTGVKYLKYGSHTYYEPVIGMNQIYGEALVEKNTYAIQNLAIVLDLIYRTKFIDFYVSAQPEKALFGKQKVTTKVLPYGDINFEHYPQKQLNEYNCSIKTGLGIRRSFGDKLSFSLKPSMQYFLLPFYEAEGFAEVKIAFHLAIGINFNLKNTEI